MISRKLIVMVVVLVIVLVGVAIAFYLIPEKLTTQRKITNVFCF